MTLPTLIKSLKSAFFFVMCFSAVGLGASASAQTLLNVSYDVSREFYKDVNAVLLQITKKPRALM